ncbi:MAG: tRNA preQ1(34) S-adenosylmethionine ribosyltransferase-isomerase QueA [Coriobacteriales bacterium]|jgi:S-adenosylmethionine:tRNA ribosyltransferase-isomerase|nr:tRNA preQ1(34) S-adenosylmethionine ribosyltransferase-isomerase QueA [Coriobacteriales bacterium]
MLTDDFNYYLPQESIAQEPASPRDSCKLLVLNRTDGSLRHCVFTDIINFLHPGDLLVANETRVMPARLQGYRLDPVTGNKLAMATGEILLLNRIDANDELCVSACHTANDNTASASCEASNEASNETSNETSHVAPNNTSAGTSCEAPQKASGKVSQKASGDTKNTELWEALVKPGRRLKPGAIMRCGTIDVTIKDWSPTKERGVRIVSLTTTDGSKLNDALHAFGTIPLPPYITNYHGQNEQYQTVYSRHEASAASPTAGLHFTDDLLKRIKAKGVGFATVDLEVGLGTFRSVEEQLIEDHVIHSEHYSVTANCAQQVKNARLNGGRIIAVGTTSVRSLESAWDAHAQQLVPCKRASTQLFIRPGYKFQVTDVLLTNFHVPRSTLLMLVSAFAGHEQIMSAYDEAIKRDYRMLSFGDAMLII